MRFALPLLLVLATASTVEAGPRMVFRLEAHGLPPEMNYVPDQFATAMARELGGVQAAFTIRDAARTQCIAVMEELSDDCLNQISENHHAKRLVFGTVYAIDGGFLNVTLTRFVRGKDGQRRSFLLKGSVVEMTDDLVEGARAWFDDLGIDLRRKRALSASGEARGAATPPRGKVSGPTMVTLVGGSALLAASIGFLYSSATIADEVHSLKPRNPDDFERLSMLEDKGQRRQTIGTVLGGVGAIALVYGTIRALRERKGVEQSDRDRLTARSGFTPVPIDGGAMLVFDRPLP